MAGKNIHMVGIKGVGMTGLATLLKGAGDTVQGSDTEEVFFTDRILKDLAIPVLPFSEKNIKSGIDEVIYSTAYTQKHPELKRAAVLDIPVYSYTEVLAELFNKKKGIMVTGTHGKTTTTAALGRILEQAGWDPTVLVGSEVIEWKRTARFGKSEWMLIEGDEYQAKMLLMRPYALLITNIDYDHPDFYKTPRDYNEAFKKLFGNLKEGGKVVIHEEILQKEGFRELVLKGNITTFNKIDLPLENIFGFHNLMNVSAAYHMAHQLGVEDDVSRDVIRRFRGTKRRLEYYTAAHASPVVLDDYAHHPKEIQAAIGAIRERYPHHYIIAVFQPHTFSRTEVFLEDFASSFYDADEIIILEVYGSAREKKGKVGGMDLFRKIRANGGNVRFVASIKQTAILLKKRTWSRDVVIATLGAGDVWRVAKALASRSI